MAKKTKQKKEWELEVEEMNRQLSENSETAREFLRVMKGKNTKLKKRKRELIEQNTNRKKPQWDDHTPLVSLVRTGMRKEFKQMTDVWQGSSGVEIDYRTTANFVFKMSSKPYIIRALSNALRLNVFKTSNNEVFRYISKHSNLGEWETIKREELRYRDKSGDKK